MICRFSRFASRQNPCLPALWAQVRCQRHNRSVEGIPTANHNQTAFFDTPPAFLDGNECRGGSRARYFTKVYKTRVRAHRPRTSGAWWPSATQIINWFESTRVDPGLQRSNQLTELNGRDIPLAR